MKKDQALRGFFKSYLDFKLREVNCGIELGVVCHFAGFIAVRYCSLAVGKEEVRLCQEVLLLTRESSICGLGATAWDEAFREGTSRGGAHRAFDYGFGRNPGDWCSLGLAVVATSAGA